MANKIDLKIDTTVGGTWDLIIEGGVGEEKHFAQVEGAEEVAQRVAVATRTQLGEYAYDTEQGLPWHEEILVKAPDIPRLVGRFRALWASIDGVTKVLSLTLTPDYTERHLLVEGTIDTEFGEAALQFAP